MSMQKTVAFLLKAEGGNYVPRPGDKNNDPNPTRNGIIQKTYDRFLRSKGLPSCSVFDVPQGTWEQHWQEIFEEGFWKVAGCDTLPEPLDLLVADAAFNSGPKQSVKFLQRAVGTVPDGVYGPKTQKAVLQSNVREVCISIIGQRIRFLKALHAKSLQAILDWKAQSDSSRSPLPPEEFPLPGLLKRMRDLQKAAAV